MRLRLLLTIALLALLSLPRPVSAAPTDDCTAPRRLDAVLNCLRKPATSSYPDRMVTLRGPLDLGKLPADPSGYAAGPLTASVPDGRTTGAGGTVLLILAGKRYVGADAVISPLSADTVKRLRTDNLCDRLCDLVGTKGAKGQDLLSNGLAGDITTLPPEPGGSGPGLERALWASIVLALLGLLGLTYQRRSTAPAPIVGGQGEYVVPSGPRRTATVRTHLHPQGYVEVDRCLVRATWADPRETPPDIGEAVEVIKDSGRLLALPISTATRRNHES